MCEVYKANILRIQKDKLHDFPFTFYNSTKHLENFNQVAFLWENNVHNVGVYRRLCQCFTQLQWGELSGELATAMLQDDVKGDAHKEFLLSGLPEELYPLGKPFKKGVEVDSIVSWDAFYKAVGLPMSSPVAIVLEVVLSLWYIVKNWAPVRKENGMRLVVVVKCCLIFLVVLLTFFYFNAHQHY